MNISIIVGHPKPGSFSHALAQAARETAEANGHTCFYHDLYAENFPALITVDEIYGKASQEPLVEQVCEEAANSDGFVIVHPNWWGQPPAVVKGWIDRVMRFGMAYTADASDPLNAVGLLKAKSALIFNTSDTPYEKEMAVFGDPLDTIWKNCVFGFCGVTNVERRTFGVMMTSTPDQRADWLNDVREAVGRHYGK
jgi:NAD(P)H dehydrogenase (quinone)